MVLRLPLLKMSKMNMKTRMKVKSEKIDLMEVKRVKVMIVAMTNQVPFLTESIIKGHIVNPNLISKNLEYHEDRNGTNQPHLKNLIKTNVKDSLNGEELLPNLKHNLHHPSHLLLITQGSLSHRLKKILRYGGNFGELLKDHIVLY